MTSEVASTANLIGGGSGDAKEMSKDIIYEFQLLEARDKILANKPANWNHLEDQGFTIGLSPKEIGLLSDFEDSSNSVEDRMTLLHETKAEGTTNGDIICSMYLKLVSVSVGNAAIKKYFLAKIDQVLTEECGIAKFFNAAESPYKPFLDVLVSQISMTDDAKEDEIIKMFACRILARLFGSLEKFYLSAIEEKKGGARRLQKKIDEPMGVFLAELKRRARTKNNLIPIKALKNTLRVDRSHEPFVLESVDSGLKDSGLKLLVSLLDPNNNNEQVLYLAGFCVWMLTFNPKMHRQIDQFDSEEKNTGLIKNMVRTVRQVQREKVIRICFAAFRNMLKSEELKGRLVGLGLLDVIKTLNQTEDEELKENTAKVSRELKSFVGQLSTFEKYTTEVMSGQLQKSAVHNETFWRKNSAMFEKESYRHIRKLVELLDSKDLHTLEMACYDLGEFARFHPDGRSIVTRMGGKSKAMKLMIHRNEAVAKQALLFIQKLMVSNWEFLTKT